MGAARRQTEAGFASKRFDLYAGRETWDPAKNTGADLEDALKELFNAVASDLGVNDYGDDAFLDYAGDTMSDKRIPEPLIRKAEKWLEAGGRGKISEDTDMTLQLREVQMGAARRQTEAVGKLHVDPHSGSDGGKIMDWLDQNGIKWTKNGPSDIEIDVDPKSVKGSMVKSQLKKIANLDIKVVKGPSAAPFTSEDEEPETKTASEKKVESALGELGNILGERRSEDDRGSEDVAGEIPWQTAGAVAKVGVGAGTEIPGTIRGPLGERAGAPAGRPVAEAEEDPEKKDDEEEPEKDKADEALATVNGILGERRSSDVRTAEDEPIGNAPGVAREQGATMGYIPWKLGEAVVATVPGTGEKVAAAVVATEEVTGRIKVKITEQTHALKGQKIAWPTALLHREMIEAEEDPAKSEKKPEDEPGTKTEMGTRGGLGEAEPPTAGGSPFGPKATELLKKMYAHKKELSPLLDELDALRAEMAKEHGKEASRLADAIDEADRGLRHIRMLLAGQFK